MLPGFNENASIICGKNNKTDVELRWINIINYTEN